MSFTTRRKMAREDGADIYDWFPKVKTYKTPSGYHVLWIPWKGWAISMTDFTAISHAVVRIGGCESRRRMRNAFVQGFIERGIELAEDAITSAPQGFIDAATAKNLY